MMIEKYNFKYFSYSPNAGLEFHETEKQARERAEESISFYDSKSWDDLVEMVCYGEVKEVATKTNVRPDPSGEYEYLCDYKLKLIEE
ncbi:MULTISPECIES: hypothetical protein [unclassified Gilliamella]|uniref:hypothetical protein n=1 Tax=unclassified Gilliamella TaxID=2685620 RepID=UPI002269DA89|nr:MULTISPECIES: hypothetical protein [unclassified Gilliamella]MCX8665336.1 hypothetical protein [Gilliamella sp. B2887]MCX8696522.1 hypothetical protein [Gilliamella sp. B2828]MCX8698263.1 hypothetical protein [Gilliamella sp. B3000]